MWAVFDNLAASYWLLAPSQTNPSETYAKMGCLGMSAGKSFGILVGVEGEGQVESCNRDIESSENPPPRAAVPQGYRRG
jgi:hypothetical protein